MPLVYSVATIYSSLSTGPLVSTEYPCIGERVEWVCSSISVICVTISISVSSTIPGVFVYLCHVVYLNHMCMNTYISFYDSAICIYYLCRGIPLDHCDCGAGGDVRDHGGSGGGDGDHCSCEQSWCVDWPK